MYDYGLSKEEFLKLTPAQFRALGKRHQIRVQQADYRAALVASILYNVYRGKNPYRTPASFFYSLQEEKESSGKSGQLEMSGQQMLLYMMNMGANKPRE